MTPKMKGAPLLAAARGHSGRGEEKGFGMKGRQKVSAALAAAVMVAAVTGCAAQPQDSDGGADEVVRQAEASVGGAFDGGASLFQEVPLDEYCEGHAREYLQWVELVDQAVASEAPRFANGWDFSHLLDADEELYGTLKARLVQGAAGETRAAIEAQCDDGSVAAWDSAEPLDVPQGMRRYLEAFVALDDIEDADRREEVSSQIDATVALLGEGGADDEAL